MSRLFPALAAILLLALPGCTAQLAEHAQKAELRDNRVAAVTQAWRTPEGRLTVCASGWPYWRARDTEPVAFHFSAPLVRETGAPRGSPHPGVDGVPVRRIAVAEAAVAEGCPEKPEGLAAIASAPASTDRFGRLTPGKARRPDVAGLAGGAGAMLWAVPVEGEPPAVAILYRHDEAIFEGSRVAWIEPGRGATYPNRPALVLMPLAVAADAAGVVLVVGVTAAIVGLAVVAVLI